MASADGPDHHHQSTSTAADSSATASGGTSSSTNPVSQAENHVELSDLQRPRQPSTQLATHAASENHQSPAIPVVKPSSTYTPSQSLPQVSDYQTSLPSQDHATRPFDMASSTDEAPNAAAAPAESPPSIENTTPSSPGRPRADTGKSEAAIGPASETPVTKPDPSSGPTVLITLLLITGARHLLKVDEKYMKKRNVSTPSMDPLSVGVYTLKELIWTDWREDWDSRPASPHAIRLIHFGQMMDDKQTLRDYRLNTENPNVLHMTVRPSELADDEEPRGGKGAAGRGDDDGERTARCRCVIL